MVITAADCDPGVNLLAAKALLWVMGGSAVVDEDTRAGSALEEVFRRHHRDLVRVAYLLLGDARDAEEAVQEAYFRVERRAQRAGNLDAALPYVRAAVVNVCRSGLRRRIVASRSPLRAVPDAATPDEEVVAREEHRAVAEAVRRLPRRQRESLVLRYYLELTDAEIAQILGVTVGSVKTHLHRGMAALGKVLEES